MGGRGQAHTDAQSAYILNGLSGRVRAQIRVQVWFLMRAGLSLAQPGE